MIKKLKIVKREGRKERKHRNDGNFPLTKTKLMVRGK